jgi:hypothetical protein
MQLNAVVKSSYGQNMCNVTFDRHATQIELTKLCKKCLHSEENGLTTTVARNVIKSVAHWKNALEVRSYGYNNWPPNNALIQSLSSSRVKMKKKYLKGEMYSLDRQFSWEIRLKMDYRAI